MENFWKIENKTTVFRFRRAILETGNRYKQSILDYRLARPRACTIAFIAYMEVAAPFLCTPLDICFSSSFIDRWWTNAEPNRVHLVAVLYEDDDEE